MTVSMRAWALWSVPRRALLVILGVEASAAAATATALWFANVSSDALGRMALLFGLSVVLGEGSDRVERFRRFLGSDRGWVNATSVWAFAGVLTLPAGYAGLLIIAVYAHTLLRGLRHQSLRPHRHTFSAATMVLATLAAAALIHLADRFTALPTGAASALSVILAIAAFHVVNQGLVGLVLVLVMRPSSWRSVLISRSDRLLELVTLILGALTGETVIHSPWLSPGVLAVIAMLYRSAQVERLQTSAATDVKTGLLNASAWREQAEGRLRRAAAAKQPVALLMIDLDHFKQINDTYGHLAGDEALRAVGASLLRDLRDRDAVGRFGGEEFAVLLENVTRDAAMALAERVRASIRNVALADGGRLSASVGVAHEAGTQYGLQALLAAADVALYEAKSSGRDLVRLSRPVAA